MTFAILPPTVPIALGRSITLVVAQLLLVSSFLLVTLSRPHRLLYLPLSTKLMTSPLSARIWFKVTKLVAVVRVRWVSWRWVGESKTFL